MASSNIAIAEIFKEIADYLVIHGANSYRINAFRNAAHMLNHYQQDIADDVYSKKNLTKLPTIGVDLAKKIEEYVYTGKCEALERLKQSAPPGLDDLLHIPGIGPKRLFYLYHELGVHSIEQLLQAARENQLVDLPSFGIKSQDYIIRAIESYLKAKKMHV